MYRGRARYSAFSSNFNTVHMLTQLREAHLYAGPPHASYISTRSTGNLPAGARVRPPAVGCPSGASANHGQEDSSVREVPDVPVGAASVSHACPPARLPRPTPMRPSWRRRSRAESPDTRYTASPPLRDAVLPRVVGPAASSPPACMRVCCGTADTHSDGPLRPVFSTARGCYGAPCELSLRLSLRINDEGSSYRDVMPTYLRYTQSVSSGLVQTYVGALQGEVKRLPYA